MSDAWHTTRLRFEGHQGVAKLHGKSVTLQRMPLLPGIAQVYSAIDYIPELHLQRIMPFAQPWRDMLPHEVAAADQFLRETV